MNLCIKCNKPATYDSPENLCDEHWIEWWVEGMTEEGFTPEQIAEHRKSVEEVVKENYNKRK